MIEIPISTCTAKTRLFR